MALKHYSIPIVNKMFSLICKSCYIGKSNIHAPLSTTNYNTTFDIVHIELLGPAYFPFTSGYLYYLAFVDAFTKFTWIYFMSHRFEAFHAFELYVIFVKI